MAKTSGIDRRDFVVGAVALGGRGGLVLIIVLVLLLVQHHRWRLGRYACRHHVVSPPKMRRRLT